MNNSSTESRKIYLGFDVSQETIEIFGVCGEKTSKGSVKIANNKATIREFLAKFEKPEKVCVVMETGTHSGWMSRLVEELGMEVIVAHARDLHLIYDSDKKNDALDAEKLARLAQYDRKLLHPTLPMDKEGQEDLLVLKARDLLVRQRTQIINIVRGLLRSLGESDKELTVDNMRESHDKIPSEYQNVFLPLLEQLSYLEIGIKNYDRQIQKLCKKYPITDRLRQIKGIGPNTSLAFVLLVGDPRRFSPPGRGCAYFGLTPEQKQSGETDKQCSISKHGNKLMRFLLIQAACYILGPFGEKSELREFGQRISARGGAIARNKAHVAVARKLIPLFLALWRHPELDYDPYFRRDQRKKQPGDREKDSIQPAKTFIELPTVRASTPTSLVTHSRRSARC